HGSFALRPHSRRGSRGNLRPGGFRTTVRGCRPRRRQSGSPSAASRLAPFPRKVQAYSRAPRSAVLDGDPTTMLVDDLLHDREAQAGAFGLGGHVRLERATHHVLGKPAARVGERKYQLVASRLDSKLVYRLGDVRLRVDRILNQVMEHLAQTGRLTLDDGAMLGELQRHV